MVEAYDKVFNFLIDLIEKNQVLPWEVPWINTGFSCPRNIRGTNYRGTNVFLLGFVSALKGYKHSVWLTFNQAKELGGTVKAGEKSTPVIFWQLQKKKESKKAEEEEEDEENEKKIAFIRIYNVFNLEQCNLPEAEMKKFEVKETSFNSIEACEKIVLNMQNKPEIKHEPIDRAYYAPGEDLIQIPEGKYFKKEEYYYSTLFHELTHSTGHKTRLNREGVAGISSFGSEEYSIEELIAEFGSAFLSNVAGIEKQPAKDHANYLSNWVKALKDQKLMLMSAAQRAQKACDYILKH